MPLTVSQTGIGGYDLGRAEVIAALVAARNLSEGVVRDDCLHAKQVPVLGQFKLLSRANHSKVLGEVTAHPLAAGELEGFCSGVEWYMALENKDKESSMLQMLDNLALRNQIKNVSNNVTGAHLLRQLRAGTSRPRLR